MLDTTSNIRLQEVLEVMSVSKEMVDFRDSANEIGIFFVKRLEN